MNRVSAPVAPPSRTTASRLTSSKYSSYLARSRPPSASLNSLDHSLEVYLYTRSIMASKFAQSQPPSVSLNWHNYGLQVHLQTRSITASKYIFKEWWRVYGDTGVTDLECVTGSIYSADPRVVRHHLIIQWKYTLYVSQLLFSLALCAISWIHANAWDPQRRVVSYLLTRFLRSSNLNSSFSWIPLGYPERCGWVLMVGYLPSSSIVSPQRPPNGASLNVLPMGVAWCSSDYARVPSAARLTVCMYRDTEILHAILWCSKSCDSNKDEYDKTKCLVVM